MRRTTWLSRIAPAFRLGVVEHLSAALTLATLDGGAWEVLCEGGELPILDGSGLPWWSALQQLKPSSRAVVTDPHWPAVLGGAISVGEARARWEPCERFVAEVEWEQGALHQRVRWDSACDDPAQIVCARTFISSAELRRAQAAGLLTQAREGQGIVWESVAAAVAVADSTPSLVVGAPLRHPQEMAMHKLLDLIGDLGLGRPGLPGVHLRVRNGGHQLNHLLLRRFLNVPA